MAVCVCEYMYDRSGNGFPHKVKLIAISTTQHMIHIDTFTNICLYIEYKNKMAHIDKHIYIYILS